MHSTAKEMIRKALTFALLLLNRALVGISIFFIVLWQKLASPFFGKVCRFNPTCSKYAAQALRRHGFLYGTMLSIRRICRCNPWFDGGDDPVPDKLLKTTPRQE
jgi:uncharacterized protein